MRRPFSILTRLLASLAIMLWALWGLGALSFQFPAAAPAPIVAGGLFALVMMAAMVCLWRPGGLTRLWRIPALAALTSLALVIWWGSILPSHQRQWIAELEHLPSITIAGDAMTVTNLRNFRWRSESDADRNWEARSFDLKGLTGVDVTLSHWSGEAIAHLIVSFVFVQGPPLALSIEVRREEGEAWSAIAGFFKRYELAYVAADERDLIGLRTHFRGEDVRIFQLRATPQQARDVLLAYVADINSLAKTPRWYDTIWVNCTTLAFGLSRNAGTDWGFRLPLDPRLLLTGHLPGYLQSLGALRADMTVAELVNASRITERARTVSLDDPAFSQKIRLGLPERMQAVAKQ